MSYRWLVVMVAGLAVAQVARAAGYDASIDWAQRVVLGTPVSGVVQEVRVSAGERVNHEAVLLRLDQTPFEAAVTEARAVLARRRSERNEARRDYRQAKELYARTVLSTVSLQDAEQRLARAQAAVEEAQARLHSAQYQLEHSVIKAPFDAWILARKVEPGQTVVASLEPPALLVVAAAGRYVARVRVPAEDLPRFTVGRPATVKVGDRTLSGTVQSVGLEPVTGGRDGAPYYEARVRFDLDGPLLRAGQAATVTVD